MVISSCCDDGILITVSTIKGRPGRDYMVVGFITTYAVSAYYHQRCEFKFRS